MGSRDSSKQVGLAIIPCRLAGNSSTTPYKFYCVHPAWRIQDLSVYQQYGQNIEWKEIYIMHRPPAHRYTASITSSHIFRADTQLSAPFRFGHLEKRQRPFDQWRQCNKVDIPWTGSPPVVLLSSFDADAKVYLYLGICGRTGASAPRSQALGPHWAYLASDGPDSEKTYLRAGQDMHDCPTDHIRDWPLSTKVFKFPAQNRPDERWKPVPYREGFQLTFSPCPINPSGSLTVYPRTLSSSRLYPDDACAELDQDIKFFRQGLNQNMHSGRHQLSFRAVQTGTSGGQTHHDFGNIARSVRTSLGLLLYSANSGPCTAGGTGQEPRLPAGDYRDYRVYRVFGGDFRAWLRPCHTLYAS
jgi:hypothetical protein